MGSRISKSMELLNSYKKFGLIFSLSLLCVVGTSSVARAISEVNYKQEFESTVLPFLESGQEIRYVAPDGMVLSGVKYIHPESKGTILILPGRCEPWLKYGEVFYDLFQKGYSIFSYDHRGQGLSPHLAPKNLQIGHIDHFANYITDLHGFVEAVLKREAPVGKPLYLLAHSMGGVISAGYLESYPSPFRSVVLAAPMLQIDTKPYPAFVARLIVNLLTKSGKSREYAIGKGDYDPYLPFLENDVTRSRARFDMTNEISDRYPTTILGGPSNGWIYRSLVASAAIAKKMGRIKTPILMLQAGADQVVKPRRQNRACRMAPKCKLLNFPLSQHEILMEQDFIRDSAFEKIEEFFQ